jgi:hypothetical protein
MRPDPLGRVCGIGVTTWCGLPGQVGRIGVTRRDLPTRVCRVGIMQPDLPARVCPVKGLW